MASLLQLLRSQAGTFDSLYQRTRYFLTQLFIFCTDDLTRIDSCPPNIYEKMYQTLLDKTQTSYGKSKRKIRD